MDGPVEGVGVGEGLVGEVIGLEIMPDNLDVVELGRVFRQPLHGEPVRALGDGGERAFAGVDRAIVFDQNDRLGHASGLWSVKMIELFQMSDKVAAAFRRARMHDALARYLIKRAPNRDFLGLPWRFYSQIGAGLCPDAGEIRMRQRLALVAVKKNDVAGCGLLFAQLQTQTNPVYLEARYRSVGPIGDGSFQ